MFRFWAMISFIVLSSGCLFRPHQASMTPADEVLLVSRNHQCTKDCRHYYHDGLWYTTDGHEHGKDCGHVLKSGVWVLEK
jgi:hypothetical protein